ncbi:MAG TPA: amino acid adenylation domain-containing protein, partial [Longimicrobiaceae bacterium]
PAVQSFRGAVHRFVLPAELADRLHALTRREGATLFMGLLAAFQALLARYARQDEVVVGSPIAGRTRVEVEGVVGNFVNALPLRADLSDDPGFRALLRRVREATLGAYQHQDVPLERVVEELRLERDLGRNPLFQAVFVLQNAPMERAGLPGLEMRVETGDTGTAKFDLTLTLEETAEGLRGRLEYSTDLWERDTAVRFAGHYGVLLESLLADPDAPVSTLPLLPPEERAMLVGAPADRFRSADTLHALFDAAAERAPDAVAVTFEGESLTYAGLRARSDRLAGVLRGMGIGPEARVGLCVERSLETVVGVLGILKAGGAYVPLDPGYPEERLAYVLADSAVPVLVTQERLAGALPEFGGEVVVLDGDGGAAADAPEPTVSVRPDSAAYVIYTSGSTGRPKGVVVTHANAVRLFTATDHWFGFGAEDVWTLFHSYAFDFSVWEIWGALLYGGRLVVVPQETARSPEAFLALLRREGVTVLSQTPSAFSSLVRAEEEAAGGSDLALRYVVFGGEALDPAALRPWTERHGEERPRLVNMYGITETTVHVTYRPVGREDVEGARGSRVGVAIPDLRVYLADRHGEPVPPGVPGEMLVGGAGVARGYLGRPELTAERFVPDPFGGEPGARLYRSGDLARLRPGGDLEYLGRIDQQVKIRGFRIELGEIEAALLEHPGVREAAVLAREDAPGDRRLVGYVVAGGAAAPSVAELRDWVGARLPEHMVPAAFVALERLPLTANGKLDRRALPAPDAARPDLGGDFVAPRTEAERVLARVWSEVLGVEEVGVRDNFFALGGDSIRSIRVVARAREAGVEVSLPQLFRGQTIEAVARSLEDAAPPESGRPADAPFALVSAQDRAKLPADVVDAYPPTRLQLGMLFHSEYTEAETAYHDIFSHHLQGPADPEALEAAAQELAARHPVLRTSFDLAGFAEPMQRVHAEARVPVTFDDLRALPDDEQEAAVAAWMEAEKGRPFDPATPPLIRFHVHLRGADRFQLTVSFHHAILDGWSVATLLTEYFALLYARLGRAEGPPEPPRASFRSYVALEAEAMRSEAARAAWGARLAGAAPTLLPRTGGGERRVATLEAAPGAELSAALHARARALGVPLKSLLLAAHLRVLGTATGEAEVTTGLVTNGRPEETDGERVAGLFLNVLPLRVALEGGSWAELARAAFAAEQEVVPLRRFPFAEIQRMAGGATLFDSAFNYVHFHVYRGLAGLPGLRVLGRRAFEETNFPLNVNFVVDPATEEVRLAIVHDLSVVGDARAAEIGEWYERALEALARDPEARHDAGLLAPSERERLLAWSAAEEAPAAGLVHDRIAERAARAPDAPALAGDGGALTYAELERRANRLARLLRSLGVGPEARVGICLERGPEVAVAMLGVLRAGGAFVPLDPGMPAERLERLAEDAGLRALVTRDRLRGLFAPGGAEVVSLDGDRERIDAEPDTAPEAAVSPESLAYVIYTSGSTGTPKGVLVEHRQLASYVGGVAARLDLPEGARYASVSTPAADLGYTMVFPALVLGGCLHLVAEETATDAEALGGLFEREGIDCLKITPSHLAALMAADRPERVLPRRRLVLGGEASRTEWVRRLRELAPGCAVHNHYGPTETTVGVLTHPVGDLPADAPATLPLGRPL